MTNQAKSSYMDKNQISCIKDNAVFSSKKKK